MSYYEWVQNFKLLKTSPMDENLIKNLESKKIEDNPYVLSRLFIHAVRTIDVRLNNSGLKCLKQMIASDLDINTLSINLIELKKEKQYVLKISQLPVFNGNHRDQLVDLINQKINEISEHLKKTIDNIDEDGKYLHVFEKIISNK